VGSFELLANEASRFNYIQKYLLKEENNKILEDKQGEVLVK